MEESAAATEAGEISAGANVPRPVKPHKRKDDQHGKSHGENEGLRPSDCGLFGQPPDFDDFEETRDFIDENKDEYWHDKNLFGD